MLSSIRFGCLESGNPPALRDVDGVDGPLDHAGIFQIDQVAPFAPLINGRGIMAAYHACNVQKRVHRGWISKDHATWSLAISPRSDVSSHGRRIGKSLVTQRRRLTQAAALRSPSKLQKRPVFAATMSVGNISRCVLLKGEQTPISAELVEDETADLGPR